MALSVNLSLKAEFSLPEILSLSQETGKNIYVEYTADWCLPCQIFEESVLSDIRVVDLIGSDFIMVKADYDNNDYKNLYSEYGVACMPTQHIINANGEVLLELSGSQSPDAFYNAILPYALSDINDVSVSASNTKKLDFTQEEIKNNTDVLKPKKPAYKSIVSGGEEIARRNLNLSKKITPENEINPKETYVNQNQKNIENNSGQLINIDYYYALQIGAYSVYDNAKKQKEKILATLNENADIVYSQDSNLYTVQLGRFQSKQDLKSLEDILKQTGIDHFVKRNKV